MSEQKYRVVVHQRDGKDTDTIDFIESIKIENEFHVYDIDMGYAGRIEIIKVGEKEAAEE